MYVPLTLLVILMHSLIDILSNMFLPETANNF